MQAAEAKSPAFWAKNRFYIEDRTDPETNDELGPGPILLAPFQKRILEAALERDATGRFRWSTVVWSAPKKCLAPETRVLTANLDWVPVGTLRIGDELLAFDENPARNTGGSARRYRIAQVLDTGLAPMLARRLYLADGTVITASHNHKWLNRTRGGANLKWRKTSKLKPGDWLSRYLPTWERPQDYDDGYMAGCLDGEGSIRADCREIGMGQKKNELLAEFKRILDDHDVQFNEYTQETYQGDYAGHTIQKIGILGGRPWNLYMLGHFRPKRLMGKMIPVLDGGIGNIWRMEDVEIVAIEETAAELVTLQTSTETYFAEGFAAHNSGKTRIAALVAAWLASHSGRYSEIYCLANDGKQSADRVLAAVKRANELGGLGWRDKMTRVEMPNGSFIEAVPVDPTGEAGANPTASIWSEMWGFRLSAKERLWTEFTIPPTRHGRAVRWVESYAGYTGESPVLEQLYHEGVEQGRRHPDFPDLPVTVNERARLFCYWDHEPRMSWQTDAYYQAEAALLTENEFNRIHRNRWVSSETEAIPIENWDLCYDPNLPPNVGPNTPVVIGVDLGVSGDSTAAVMVSRHPANHDLIAIRLTRVWKPPKGGKIDYSTTIEPTLREWCKRYHVVAVAYDEYQAHKMMTDLRREGLAWFVDFPQGKGTKQKPGRPVADKMTYDLVMSRKLAHLNDPEMREHVQNAAGKSVEERYMRFVKKAQRLRIDLLVAASMAICTIGRLNV